MKLPLTLAAAALATVAVPAAAADLLARVISSTPVVQQIMVPRQVCSSQAVVTEAPRSGAGALLGAVAGGAAGNAVGNGSGRAVATILGLMGGAVLGNNIEGGGTQVQNVQQCTTQTFYENRPSHYNVVYEYQGTQYNAQMPSDPGQYVRLQVMPVGAVNAWPQPAFPITPQSYYPPSVPAPLQGYAPPIAPQVIYSRSLFAPLGVFPQADFYHAGSQPLHSSSYFLPYSAPDLWSGDLHSGSFVQPSHYQRPLHSVPQHAPAPGYQRTYGGHHGYWK